MALVSVSVVDSSSVLFPVRSEGTSRNVAASPHRFSHGALTVTGLSSPSAKPVSRKHSVSVLLRVSRRLWISAMMCK